MFLRKKRKGQAIVEMALVFPFFLLIIVGGIIDFGFDFYNHLSVQQIANDTAQWATDNYTPVSPISTSEMAEHANMLKPAWWTGAYTVKPTLSQLATGENTVDVLIVYDSPTYTPFYQTMFKAASGVPVIRLASRAVYKIPENPR